MVVIVAEKAECKIMHVGKKKKMWYPAQGSKGGVSKVMRMFLTSHKKCSCQARKGKKAAGSA